MLNSYDSSLCSSNALAKYSRRFGWTGNEMQPKRGKDVPSLQAVLCRLIYETGICQFCTYMYTYQVCRSLWGIEVVCVQGIDYRWGSSSSSGIYRQIIYRYSKYVLIEFLTLALFILHAFQLWLYMVLNAFQDWNQAMLQQQQQTKIARGVDGCPNV